MTLKPKYRREHYFGQDSVVGPYSLAGGKRGKSKGKGMTRTKAYVANQKEFFGTIMRCHQC